MIEVISEGKRGNSVLLIKNCQDRIDASTYCLLARYLTLYGDTELTQTILQKNMEYFLVEPFGFVAFRRTKFLGRTTLFVLGKPICDVSKLETLLNFFHEHFETKIVYTQIDDYTAKVLRNSLGYYVNEMGVVTELDVQECNLSGSSMQTVRTAISKSKAAGIYFEANGNATSEEIDNLTSQWMRGKTSNRGELEFLTRPLVKQPEHDTLIITARIRSDDKLQGYFVFNPMYRNGKRYGYCLDVMRTCADSPKGLVSALVCEAIDIFKAMNVEHENNVVAEMEPHRIDTLSLGISPGYMVHDDKDWNNPLTSVIIHGIFQFGNSFYNYKGIAGFKSIFKGKLKKRFFASPSLFQLNELILLQATCGIDIFFTGRFKSVLKRAALWTS